MNDLARYEERTLDIARPEPVSRLPAKEATFGFAIRLSASRSQIMQLVMAQVFLFAVAIGSMWMIAGQSGTAALVEAKNAHIASLEQTNAYLADANERLSQAHSELAEVAKATPLGTSKRGVVLLGATIMLAAGLTLILIPGIAMGGVAFIAFGLVVLFNAGSFV